MVAGGCCSDCSWPRARSSGRGRRSRRRSGCPLSRSRPRSRLWTRRSRPTPTATRSRSGSSRTRLRVRSERSTVPVAAPGRPRRSISSRTIRWSWIHRRAPWSCRTARSSSCGPPTATATATRCCAPRRARPPVRGRPRMFATSPAAPGSKASRRARTGASSSSRWTPGLGRSRTPSRPQARPGVPPRRWVLPPATRSRGSRWRPTAARWRSARESAAGCRASGRATARPVETGVARRRWGSPSA